MVTCFVTGVHLTASEARLCQCVHFVRADDTNLVITEIVDVCRRAARNQNRCSDWPSTGKASTQASRISQRSHVEIKFNNRIASSFGHDRHMNSVTEGGFVTSAKVSPKQVSVITPALSSSFAFLGCQLSIQH